MADPRRSLTPARSSPSGRHAWAGRRAAVRGALVLVWCAGGCAALGQLVADPKTENPVFVDESPAVVEGLTRAKEHLAGGNVDQAARTLMKVLDERPESLVASGADPML
ncbi:MAG: hypothetical protein K2Q09_07845, partial [Phycisphaerales bacterium]|nr:hypothetical protein [Phycisphaerales bacterium]